MRRRWAFLLVALVVELVSALQADPISYGPSGPTLPSSMAAWKVLHFSSEELADGASDDLASPAGDGVPNLLKYALNLDPHVPISAPVTIPILSEDGQTLSMQFTRNPSASDIELTIEVSGDLETWNSGSGYTQQVSAMNNADGTQTVVVQDLTAWPTGATPQSQFMRLKVVRTNLDTDQNGLPDDWELAYFGHIGVDPNADADGDGYPNIYEYTHGSDPTSASSVPAPDFVVDASAPTTTASKTAAAEPPNYQTIQSALYALTQDYQIIAVKPGVYQEEYLTINGYKVMLRSTDGAAATVIDGNKTFYTLTAYQDCVLEGFSIINGFYSAVQVGFANAQLSNCILRDNQTSYGVVSSSFGSVSLTNCTLFNNAVSAGSFAIQTESGTVNLENTIAWDGGNEVGVDQDTGQVAVTATYSDIQGTAVYPGQGNLNSDPRLRQDGHLFAGSPCIDAGTAAGAPDSDMDNEARPVGVGYDIGTDEYVDSNGNGLPDWWQLAYFGHLGVNPSDLSPNGDQLTNLQNYQQQNDPINPIDSNGISYAWELQYFGQIHIDPNADPDGDGYNNFYEYIHHTDPTSASSVPVADFVADAAGSTNYPTIQSALDAVTQDYQIVEVMPGTYGETTGIYNFKTMLRSTNGAAVTTIDAQGQYATSLYLGEDSVVDGFTFINSGTNVIYDWYANAQLLNCVVRNNQGGVAYVYGGNLSVVNSTIFNNTFAPGNYGFGLYSGSLDLLNTILWDSGVEIYPDYSPAQVTANYCDIRGASIYPGQGNINSDPLLWPDGHLGLGSPCIDKGTATGAPKLDMDHDQRPAGAGYDIGADEYVNNDPSGLPNWWQLAYFGHLGVNPGDLSPNGDGLTNLQNYQQLIDPINPIDSNGISYAWELQYFGQIHIDPNADPDGDGYSNFYEYVHGTDPTSASSAPAADFVVDAAGSTSYMSIQSALAAVTQDYQIIEVMPGTYPEQNLSISNHKILLRSTDGAAVTIIDSRLYGNGLNINADVVVDGFSLINGSHNSVQVTNANAQLINCVLRNNQTSHGVLYSYGGSLSVTNCTLFNNSIGAGSFAIQTGGGAVNLVNTIAWDGGSEIGVDDYSGQLAVTASYCDIQGASAFPGQGNINGDPLLWPDGHISTGSPCIDAGTAAGAPKRDMDNEQRPAGAGYDIGADEYVDSNGSGLPDWWQLKYFGHLGVNPNDPSPNGDGLSNLQNYEQQNDPNNPIDTNGISYAWELQYFGHTHIDPNADPDRDGYSNIYEYTHGSDPTSASSVPGADFVVDAAGSSDYKTIQSALNAVTRDYQIVAVMPGTYQGGLYIPNHKMMLRSTDGAAVTIVDAHQGSSCLSLDSADYVINGFSFINGNGNSVQVFFSTAQLINCVLRGNQTFSGVLYCYGGNISVSNCTLVNNSIGNGSYAIETLNGTISLTNTIAWDGENEIGRDLNTGQVSVTATYSDIEGATVYPGQGNINSDPLLRQDGHLFAGSPCIDTGTATGAPKLDMDNEQRPVGAGYDIGADEYLDSNGNGLPDWWQLTYYRHLGVVPGELSPIGNGLTNLQNYQQQINQMDSNGFSYVWEMEYFGRTGIDPLANSPNGDRLTNLQNYQMHIDPVNPIDSNGLPYAWEIRYFGHIGVDPSADPDGDGLTNFQEYQLGTDPTNPDTDGDGVIDSLDAYPLDPTRWQAPVPDPNDHTPPVITLIEPADAILLPGNIRPSSVRLTHQ